MDGNRKTIIAGDILVWTGMGISVAMVWMDNIPLGLSITWLAGMFGGTALGVVGRWRRENQDKAAETMRHAKCQPDPP